MPKYTITLADGREFPIEADRDLEPQELDQVASSIMAQVPAPPPTFTRSELAGLTDFMNAASAAANPPEAQAQPPNIPMAEPGVQLRQPAPAPEDPWTALHGLAEIAKGIPQGVAQQATGFLEMGGRADEVLRRQLPPSLRFLNPVSASMLGLPALASDPDAPAPAVTRAKEIEALVNEVTNSDPRADLTRATGQGLGQVGAAIATALLVPEMLPLQAASKLPVIGGVATALTKAPIVGKALAKLGTRALTAGASMFGAEFSDAFNRAVDEQHMDPDEAFLKSMEYAAVSAGIESKFGAGRFAEKIGKKLLPSVIKEMAEKGVSKSALLEFLGGYVPDVLMNFAEEATQRLAQDLIIEGKPRWDQIFKEGAVGGIVAALVGLPVNVSSATRITSAQREARYQWNSALNAARDPNALHFEDVQLDADRPAGVPPRVPDGAIGARAAMEKAALLGNDEEFEKAKSLMASVAGGKIADATAAEIRAAQTKFLASMNDIAAKVRAADAKKPGMKAHEWDAVLAAEGVDPERVTWNDGRGFVDNATGLPTDSPVDANGRPNGEQEAFTRGGRIVLNRGSILGDIPSVQGAFRSKARRQREHLRQVIREEVAHTALRTPRGGLRMRQFLADAWAQSPNEMNAAYALLVQNGYSFEQAGEEFVAKLYRQQGWFQHLTDLFAKKLTEWFPSLGPLSPIRAGRLLVRQLIEDSRAGQLGGQGGAMRRSPNVDETAIPVGISPTAASVTVGPSPRPPSNVPGAIANLPSAPVPTGPSPRPPSTVPIGTAPIPSAEVPTSEIPWLANRKEPDATGEIPVEGSVQPQRSGGDEGGKTAEAGPGDSVRGAETGGGEATQTPPEVLTNGLTKEQASVLAAFEAMGAAPAEWTPALKQVAARLNLPTDTLLPRDLFNLLAAIKRQNSPEGIEEQRKYEARREEAFKQARKIKPGTKVGSRIVLVNSDDRVVTIAADSVGAAVPTRTADIGGELALPILNGAAIVEPSAEVTQRLAKLKKDWGVVTVPMDQIIDAVLGRETKPPAPATEGPVSATTPPPAETPPGLVTPERAEELKKRIRDRLGSKPTQSEKPAEPTPPPATPEPTAVDRMQPDSEPPPPLSPETQAHLASLPEIPLTNASEIVPPIAELPVGAGVRVTLADGSSITGTLRSAGGQRWIDQGSDGSEVVLLHGDPLTVMRASKGDQRDPVVKFEVTKPTEGADAKKARIQGEQIITTQPTTAEEYEAALWKLAEAMHDADPNRFKILADQDYGDRLARSRRRMQIERQFDDLADQIKLAKAKRRWMIANAVPHREGKPLSPGDGFSSPPKPTDFSPDPAVRATRTPRPVESYPTQAQLQEQVRGAEAAIRRTKPGSKNRKAAETTLADAQRKLDKGLYREAVEAKRNAPPKAKPAGRERLPDLIDEIEGSFGTIDPKLIREANPDWKPVGAARRLFRSSGRPADVALQSLTFNGGAFGLTADMGMDAFGEAINAAARARTTQRKGWTTESRKLDELGKTAGRFDDLVHTSREGSIAITVDDLHQGDSIQIAGDTFAVIGAEFDEDGRVLSLSLDGGQKWGVQTVSGMLLHIDLQPGIVRAQRTSNFLPIDAVPEAQLESVRKALKVLQTVRDAIDATPLRTTEVLSSNAKAIEEARKAIEAFIDEAEANGIDTEMVFTELGGLPDISPPQKAANYTVEAGKDGTKKLVRNKDGALVAILTVRGDYGTGPADMMGVMGTSDEELAQIKAEIEPKLGFPIRSVSSTTTITAPPRTGFFDTIESDEDRRDREAREAAQRKAAADKNKIIDLANRPLTGTAGDLGQGDMFKAPEDLFAPPPPTPKPSRFSAGDRVQWDDYGITRTGRVREVTPLGVSVNDDDSGRNYLLSSDKLSTPTPPATSPPPAPGLVSNDRADELRRRIKDRLKKNKEDSGDGPAYSRKEVSRPDPALLADMIELGVFEIQGGARSFEQFSQGMIAAFGDDVRPWLRAAYEGARAYPGEDYSQDMTPAETVRTLAQSYVAGTNPNPSPAGTGARGEPGPATPGAVPPGQPGTVPGGGPVADLAGDNAGSGPVGGIGVRGDLPVDAGPRPPAGVPGEPGPAAAPAGNAGNQQPRGGRSTGQSGVSIGSRSDLGTPGHPKQPVSPDAPADRLGSYPGEDPAGEQSAANAKHLPWIAGDADNLNASLPYLFPEQRGDVMKVERRFFLEPTRPATSASGTGLGDPKRGMLLTNGTGTGKTYSGMGVIRRFIQQGKGRILVVAPNNGVCQAWIEAGDRMGVPVNLLPDTKSVGRGVVVTTYANMRTNPSLQTEDWDLVVTDEAHHILSNEQGEFTAGIYAFRAIANHPNAVMEKAATRIIGPAPTADQFPDRGEYLDKIREYNHRKEANATRILAEARRITDLNTRVLFLSATPFAYHKALQMAEGFLFSLPDDSGRSGGYNTPTGFSRFLVENLGYRMRYGKLTEPGKEVNIDLMEMQLHDFLEKRGAISGRVIDVPADYSRDFVVIDSSVAKILDRGFSFFRGPEGFKKYRTLAQVFNALWDYNHVAQMLEAVKMEAAHDRIAAHIAMGRKVILLHSYLQAKVAAHPFRFGTYPYEATEGVNPISLQSEIRAFEAEHPEWVNLDMPNSERALEKLQRAFGDAIVFNNGTVSTRKRMEAREDFNRDDGPVRLLAGQLQATKEGISLHDTTGRHQRVMMMVALPTRPTDAAQAEGRAYRIGVKTDAINEYLVLHTMMERFQFASRINEKVATVETLALGSLARRLRDRFKEGYLNPTTEEPNDQQGTGGKELDRRMEQISDFDRAVTFYHARQKKNSRTKSAEGIDYYPTPEPLGLKMVEWAQPVTGEKLLEPSAGHGAIGRWFPDHTERTFVEPSAELRSELGIKVNGGRIVAGKFEELHISNKYDTIVMNPPFGTAGKLAAEHLVKALTHLRAGGRVVALVPDGPAMNTRLENLLYAAEPDTWGGDSIHLRARIHLPSVVFEQAGTSVRTQILIIDRVAEGDNRMVENQSPRDITAESIGDFFEAIRNMEAPDRLRIIPAVPPMTRDTILPAMVPTGEQATVGRSAAGLVESAQTKHAQKGINLYVGRLTRRINSEQYRKVNAIAKGLGGYYSSYQKAGAIPGFQFETPEARDNFAVQVAALEARNWMDEDDTAYSRKPDPEFSRERSREIAQAYTSAGTSLPNNRPALFGVVDARDGWKPGTRNVDFGAGKSVWMDQALDARGVSNLRYDPFNVDYERNLDTVAATLARPADTVTAANVLNVIAPEGALRETIRQTARLLAPDGTAYFWVHYEPGKKSGVPKGRPDSWQWHQKADWYVPALSEFFGKVEVVGSNMLIASAPVHVPGEWSPASDQPAFSMKPSAAKALDGEDVAAFLNRRSEMTRVANFAQSMQIPRDAVDITWAINGPPVSRDGGRIGINAAAPEFATFASSTPILQWVREDLGLDEPPFFSRKPLGYEFTPNGGDQNIARIGYITGKHNDRIEARAVARGDIGILVTPNSSHSVEVARRYPFFAIDNGVFGKKGFNADQFNRLLDKLNPNEPRLLFVVAPDVVGDAEATLARFPEWEKRIHERGLPVALAAQDGLEDRFDQVPWDNVDVLFIGGSDEWKIGQFKDADRRRRWERLMGEAHSRGIPIHMGRVNSNLRLTGHAIDVGASTADGTMLAFAPDENLRQLEGWLDQINQNGLPYAARYFYELGRLPTRQEIYEVAAEIESMAADLGAYEPARRDIAEARRALFGLRSRPQINGPVQTEFMFSRKPAPMVRSFRVLEEATRKFESWKDWYQQEKAAIDSMFGKDSPLFLKILAATSANTTVAGNVSLALKAYGQMIRGEPFTGYLGQVIENLERVRDHDLHPEGLKIHPFSRALEGDASAIAVDRHILRAIFGDRDVKPTAENVRKAQDVIRNIAAKHGWTPRETQAALWAWNIAREGKTPGRYTDALNPDVVAGARAGSRDAEGVRERQGAQRRVEGPDVAYSLKTPPDHASLEPVIAEVQREFPSAPRIDISNEDGDRGAYYDEGNKRIVVVPTMMPRSKAGRRAEIIAALNSAAVQTIPDGWWQRYWNEMDRANPELLSRIGRAIKADPSTTGGRRAILGRLVQDYSFGTARGMVLSVLRALRAIGPESTPERVATSIRMALEREADKYRPKTAIPTEPEASPDQVYADQHSAIWHAVSPIVTGLEERVAELHAKQLEDAQFAPIRNRITRIADEMEAISIGNGRRVRPQLSAPDFLERARSFGVPLLASDAETHAAYVAEMSARNTVSLMIALDKNRATEAFLTVNMPEFPLGPLRTRITRQEARLAQIEEGSPDIYSRATFIRARLDAMPEARATMDALADPAMQEWVEIVHRIQDSGVEPRTLGKMSEGLRNSARTAAGMFAFHARALRRQIDERLDTITDSNLRILNGVRAARLEKRREQGEIEVAIHELLRAAAGDQAASGGLFTLAQAENIRALGIAAVARFARYLGQVAPGSTGEDLRDAFIEGSVGNYLRQNLSAPPEANPIVAAARDAGITVDTMRGILDLAADLPDFRNVVLTVANEADRRSEENLLNFIERLRSFRQREMPPLPEPPDMVEENTPPADVIAAERREMARNRRIALREFNRRVREVLAPRLGQLRLQSEEAGRTVTELERQIEALERELRANQIVADSVERIHATANTHLPDEFGVAEMVYRTSNGEYLREFIKADGTVQSAMRLSPSAEYTREVLERIMEWRENAIAAAAAGTNPPEVSRGLNVAAGYVLGMANAHALHGGIGRTLAPNGLSQQWTTWPTGIRGALARLVPGIFGRRLATEMANYARQGGRIQAVLNRHLATRMRYLRKAIESLDLHANNSVELAAFARAYSETAHRLRVFGSTVSVGDRLFNSDFSLFVTQDLLNLIRYDRDIFREVQDLAQSEPYGGIRESLPGGIRLIRPAAETGDVGLARYAHRDFETMLATAYTEREEAAKRLGIVLDMVPVWNAHIRTLTSHILDTDRTDLAFDRDPILKPLELRYASDLRAGRVNPPQTFQDAVATMAAYAGTTISNPHDTIARLLNDELMRYARVARSRVSRLGASTTPIDASGVHVGEDDTNEFTSPAAKLIYPSAHYSYGAETDIRQAVERLADRSQVAMLDALDSAASSLQALVTRLRSNQPTQEDLDLVKWHTPNMTDAPWTERVDAAIPAISARAALMKAEKARLTASWSQQAPSGFGMVMRTIFPLILGWPRAAITNIVGGPVASLPILSATYGRPAAVFLATASAIANTINFGIEMANGALALAGFQFRGNRSEALDWLESIGLGQSSHSHFEIQEMQLHMMGPGVAKATARALARFGDVVERRIGRHIGVAAGDRVLNRFAAQVVVPLQLRRMRELAIRWQARLAKAGVTPGITSDLRYTFNEQDSIHAPRLREQLEEAGLNPDAFLARLANGEIDSRKFWRDEDGAKFGEAIIGEFNAATRTNRPHPNSLLSLLGWTSSTISRALDLFRARPDIGRVRRAGHWMVGAAATAATWAVSKYLQDAARQAFNEIQTSSSQSLANLLAAPPGAGGDDDPWKWVAWFRNIFARAAAAFEVNSTRKLMPWEKSWWNRPWTEIAGEVAAAIPGGVGADRLVEGGAGKTPTMGIVYQGVEASFLALKALWKWIGEGNHVEAETNARMSIRSAAGLGGELGRAISNFITPQRRESVRDIRAAADQAGIRYQPAKGRSGFSAFDNTPTRGPLLDAALAVGKATTEEGRVAAAERVKEIGRSIYQAAYDRVIERGGFATDREAQLAADAAGRRAVQAALSEIEPVTRALGRSVTPTEFSKLKASGALDTQAAKEESTAVGTAARILANTRTGTNRPLATETAAVTSPIASSYLGGAQTNLGGGGGGGGTRDAGLAAFNSRLGGGRGRARIGLKLRRGRKVRLGKIGKAAKLSLRKSPKLGVVKLRKKKKI